MHFRESRSRRGDVSPLVEAEACFGQAEKSSIGLWIV
uniref:Uncharacterized protein n=1 Tax=Arundo donax TaxID=35708 RepID=A0A0A9HIG9_ARUDO